MRSACPFPADLPSMHPRLPLARRGRRPDDPNASLPLTFRQRTFAFSCWRRGTAKRWMRSDALPYSKTSTEGKNASSVSRRLPPSPTGEGIFVPPPVLVFPCRGRRPRRPERFSPARLPSTHLCLLLWEKGDRSAVDEECVPLFPPTFRQRTFAFSCWRRGDRSAVDEE